MKNRRTKQNVILTTQFPDDKNDKDIGELRKY